MGGIPGGKGEDASGLSRCSWPPSPSGGKPLTGPSTQPPRAAEQMRFRACRRRAVKGGRCCSADARLREGRTRLCPQTQAARSAPEKTGQRGFEGGLAPHLPSWEEINGRSGGQDPPRGHRPPPQGKNGALQNRPPRPERAGGRKTRGGGAMPPRTLPIGRLAARGYRAPRRRWDEVLVGLVERGPMKSLARNANVASRARPRPAGPSSRWPEEGRELKGPGR